MRCCLTRAFVFVFFFHSRSFNGCFLNFLFISRREAGNGAAGTAAECVGRWLAEEDLHMSACFSALKRTEDVKGEAEEL